MDIIRRPGITSTPESIVQAAAETVPAQVSHCGPEAQEIWLEFFAAQTRNPNTSAAYARADHRLFDWLIEHGSLDVREVRQVRIAAWLESPKREASRPTVKLELAAIRRLFDWRTVRQVVPILPEAAAREPKHSVRHGKTPVLPPAGCRRYLRSIPVETIGGLRDRALVAVMTYGFARVSGALIMNVKDVFHMEGRLWLRLHEKGGEAPEILATISRNRISRPMSRKPGSTVTAKIPSSALSAATARLQADASAGTLPGRCSQGVPGQRRSRRPSAITRSGHPESPPTLRTRKCGSSWPSTLLVVLRRRQRSSTTGARNASRSTRLSGSEFVVEQRDLVWSKKCAADSELEKSWIP